MHHINYFPFHPKVTPKKKKAKQAKPFKGHKVFYPNEENKRYYIGSFVLGTSNNNIPDAWSYCYVQLENSTETDYLIVEFCDGSSTVITLLADAPTIIDIAATKLFHVGFVKSDDNIEIQLYFSQLPISHNPTKRSSNIMKEVFQIIFNIDKTELNKTNDDEESTDPMESLQDMYKKIRISQKRCDLDKTDIRSEHLRPILRPYQEDAVRWMIKRETVENSDDVPHPAFIPVDLPSGLKIYYNQFLGLVELNQPFVKALKTGGILADEMGLGKTVEIISCILNHQKEEIIDDVVEDIVPVVVKPGKKRARPADDKTDVDYINYIDLSKKPKLPSRKGKSPVKAALQAWYNTMLRSVNDTDSRPTIDILCICGSNSKEDLIECVDCSKKQHAACMGYKKACGEYLCPQCWKKRPLLESKATLIVCPPSLREQWTDEICKHVKSGLTVLQYEGSHALPVYPTELMKYDLVITTYNVLQNDIRLVDGGDTKSLRRKSKYGVAGSPITLVKWWRLCFDEAQVVESSDSMVHEMAQKLTAHHRWAVTGTPISKGLSDLYTLIDFLQLEPYNDVDSWNNILYMPYVRGYGDPMVNFLSKIMWRTQKDDVLNQIQIPSQTMQVYVSEFTGVERYFYDREHEMSCEDFLAKLRRHDLNKTLKSLGRSDLKKLMQPVLCLRKACAHPNTVKGRYLVTRKQVRSMTELLDALIAKILSECEEHLRAIIACLNGLAGIYIIRSNIPQAIEEYKKAMKIVATYSNNKNTDLQLTIDKLQQIHTLYNLDQQMLLSKTFNDGTLRSDCADLEQAYILKFNTQTIASIQSCSKYSDNIFESQSEYIFDHAQWYLAIVEHISESEEFEELRAKITNILDNYNYVNKNMMEIQTTLHYGNEAMILNYIIKWDEAIHDLRADAVAAVNDIYSLEDGKVNVSPEVVAAASACHLRPDKKKPDDYLDCIICTANFKIKEYEKKLFFTTLQVKRQKELNCRRCRPSIEEEVLKVIYHAGRYKNEIDKDVISDAKLSIALFELYKKEFKELRKLWTSLDAQICAFDEIDICKIRLQLKEEEQDINVPINMAEIKKLSYDIQNPTANIHRLSEFELEYQMSSLKSEATSSTKQLERCLGTHKYLQTLHTQQDAGLQPDPCPICHSQLGTKWNILKCGHCYCLECIQVLISRHQKSFECSICREKQTLSDINYIETNAKPPIEDFDKIKGDCSTKMEAVTKHVLKLMESEADVKLLVFSNWPDILKLLGEIFQQNNINSLILSSNNLEKNLDQFKDPNQNVTALLLPLKLGSKGLNLIEATHVYFLEPVLDPAEELQAVGRVHRIGQTRPTFVHKFLIKDTIDESIHLATSTNVTGWHKNKVTLHQIKSLFTTKHSSGSSN